MLIFLSLSLSKMKFLSKYNNILLSKYYIDDVLVVVINLHTTIQESEYGASQNNIGCILDIFEKKGFEN